LQFKDKQMGPQTLPNFLKMSIKHYIILLFT
jgi:hypothetical protein